MNLRKWIVWMGLLLIVFMICTAVLFSGYRRITVISGDRFVHKCPKYAKPGQTVTVMTSVISDGELYVNGVDGKYVRPGVYVFTMPDEDVQIKVTVISNPNGA